MYVLSLFCLSNTCILYSGVSSFGIADLVNASVSDCKVVVSKWNLKLKVRRLLSNQCSSRADTCLTC